ncbi:MAG: helix-turn-helix domain-containing protein [archaeon]
MQEKVIGALKSIGFSKNETIVYLDLVRNKPSLANEITRRTKVYKSNTYEALKGLIAKGFVEEVFKENKRFFAAKNPQFLIDYLSQKEREMKQIIPIITTHFNEDSYNEQEVSLTNGILAARNSILDLLKSDSEICSYSVPSEFLDVLGDWFMDRFHKKRIERKIPLRMVFDENFEEGIKKLNKMPYTEAHHSGLSYSSSTFISICGDTVLTIVLSDPIYVLTVKNREIVKSYRDYFEIIWKNSKK